MFNQFDRVNKVVNDIISEVFCLNRDHTISVDKSRVKVVTATSGNKQLVMAPAVIDNDSHRSNRSRKFYRL